MINMPEHICIVMDGNGRWAKSQGIPRIRGHRVGIQKAKEIALYCNEIGIKNLTLYAFSTENWKRPSDEVNGIFELAEQFFLKDVKNLHACGIKIRVIGDMKRLPCNIRSFVATAEDLTKSNCGTVVNVALNYGGRWDICNAAKLIAEEAINGKISIHDINEDLISSKLSTSGLPDPDLFIRTGGEYRLSNFLIWQVAYTELYVTNKLWPDFSAGDLDEAIKFFLQRDRRFGGIKES